jgi:ATP-dependent helicase HrpA
MRLEDLLRDQLPSDVQQQYPDALEISGMRLPLRYRFEPGQTIDGATLMVPAAVLGQLDPASLDWLVPGLLPTKIEALLRGLPKGLRRHFVPIPQFLERLLPELRAGEQPLLRALGEAIHHLTGVRVPEDAWRPDLLPPHLQMKVGVVDGHGKLIASGADLTRLKRDHAGQETVADLAPRLSAQEQHGATDWVFGALPEQLPVERNGMRLAGFPALIDEGETVGVRVLDSAVAAARSHRAGLLRLLQLRLSKEVRRVRNTLRGLVGRFAHYGLAQQRGDGAPSVEQELLWLILERAALANAESAWQVRDAAQFAAALRSARAGSERVMSETLQLVEAIMAAYGDVRSALAGITQAAWQASVADIRTQLDDLVYRGFLAEVPWQHLQDYPRYLNALQQRIGKLRQTPTRDQARMQEMAALSARWRERRDQVQAAGRVDERLEEIRWMLEELRVSLFAQELKTAYPVSVKRIERRWTQLGL